MPRQFFVIILLLLFFSACAQMKAGPTPQPPVKQSKHTKAAGDLKKLLDDFKADYARNPQNQALVKEYVRSLEEIKTAADMELEMEEFFSAGKDYKVLHKYFVNFRSFAHRLSFNRTELDAKIEICKDALSKKGFQEYRQGNLNQAILLWQDYLSIDPLNTDIQKALKTAKLQQKNLQQAEQQEGPHE